MLFLLDDVKGPQIEIAHSRPRVNPELLEPLHV